MTSETLNPYLSPRSDTARRTPVIADPNAPLKVALLERAWRYRRVQLEGRLDAVLEWNARWPFEFILVNNRRVAVRKTAFWYADHFEFVLETTFQAIRVAVDIRLSAFFDSVKKFQISVNDEVVYSE